MKIKGNCRICNGYLCVNMIVVCNGCSLENDYNEDAVVHLHPTCLKCGIEFKPKLRRTLNIPTLLWRCEKDSKNRIRFTLSPAYEDWFWGQSASALEAFQEMNRKLNGEAKTGG